MTLVSATHQLFKLAPLALFAPVMISHATIVETKSSTLTAAIQHSSSSPFETIEIEGEAVSRSMPWESELTRDQLDSLQIQNWSELSRRAEPGIYFNENNKSLNVRGLDKNRVLTRIDGIRQTWLSDVARGVRGGLNTVDFNSLSAIDIIRGTDSSSAGSGAMGGVVDLRTLSPGDLLKQGKTFGSLLKGGYNSADQSVMTSAALAGQAAAATQWLLQAGVQKGAETINMGTTGGHGVLRTQPNPDDYLQQSYLLKLQQKFEGGHAVGLSGTYFERQDQSIDLAASTLNYVRGKNDLKDTTRRESVAMDYAWRSPGESALLDTLDAQLYWQRVKLSSKLDAQRISTPAGRYSRDNSLQDSTQGLNVQATKFVRGYVTQLWTFGAEWTGNTTEQAAKGEDNCPVRISRGSACNFLRTNQADMPKINGTQTGVWVQNAVGLSDRSFTLTPGLRYDHFQQTPEKTTRFNKNSAGGLLSAASSGEAVSPKLQASWSPGSQVSLFAQYAFGFNAPSATQLYSRFGAPGTYLLAGNPELKPEKSQGWELGTTLGDDKLNGTFTYFDNNYQDFIEAVNRPGNALYPYFVQSYENLDRVRIYGLEAKGTWEFSKGWRMFGSLAWAVGKNQNTAQYLNSVAPLTAIAGLAYRREQWGARASLTAVAARNNVSYPETTSATKFADFQAPGYGLADLTAYWKPAEFKGLSLQAGVYNLFNKQYVNALNVPTAGAVPIPRATDFYTAPGRSFQVSVIYQY